MDEFGFAAEVRVLNKVGTLFCAVFERKFSLSVNANVAHIAFAGTFNDEGVPFAEPLDSMWTVDETAPSFSVVIHEAFR